MLRLLLSRALLVALPFVVYFVWRELARRSGREMGATPWGWLLGAGALLAGLSLMASVAFHHDNRGEGYVPAEAQPGGKIIPGGFDPARRPPPAALRRPQHRALMSRRIDQPWMSDPAIRAVIAALEVAGGPDCARFVGGCVRDSLLERPVSDFDIATRLAPPQVIAALEAAGLRAVPTGVEHGTVTAISERRPFEITTLRRDVETDGRRAVVAFTDDWAEDAARRDFRLNALYLDVQGTIHDPIGGGVDDALAGRIVFVGDAATRIREDYLRILRFFRFFAWYGRGEPDAAGLAACAALKDGLSTLSAERIAKELLKLLAAPDPRPALRFMAECGVLAMLLPPRLDRPRFEAMVDIDADALLRLAALLPGDGAVAAETAQRLRLSNPMRDRLIAALTPGPSLADPSPKAARRALYVLGRRAFEDRVRLALAAARGADTPWREHLALAEKWTRPVLPVGGADAKALGIAAGPKLGEALREVEAWWIDEDFAPDREALLARLGARA